MKPAWLNSVIALYFLTLIGPSPASALNEATHEIVNEQAARQSSFDRVLKEQLGFQRGIEQFFAGRQAFQWLREGGSREDAPLCRSARHFHDPLKAFELDQQDGQWRLRVP